MSFFGMGSMEILMILVIAFVFLGPERMVDAARLLGKAVREGRRLASELPQVVIDDEDIKIANQDGSISSKQADNEPSGDEGHSSDESGACLDKDAPVSFKAGDHSFTGQDTPSERESQ